MSLHLLGFLPFLEHPKTQEHKFSALTLAGIIFRARFACFPGCHAKAPFLLTSEVLVKRRQSDRGNEIVPPCVDLGKQIPSFDFVCIPNPSQRGAPLHNYGKHQSSGIPAEPISHSRIPPDEQKRQSRGAGPHPLASRAIASGDALDGESLHGDAFIGWHHA
jgi:hypothetical protein